MKQQAIDSFRRSILISEVMRRASGQPDPKGSKGKLMPSR